MIYKFPPMGTEGKENVILRNQSAVDLDVASDVSGSDVVGTGSLTLP
jgi:hypothetical protein